MTWRYRDGTHVGRDLRGYDSWLNRGCDDGYDDPECECCGDSVAEEVELDWDGYSMSADVPELCKRCVRRGCTETECHHDCEGCGESVGYHAEAGEVCERCERFGAASHAALTEGSQ